MPTQFTPQTFRHVPTMISGLAGVVVGLTFVLAGTTRGAFSPMTLIGVAIALTSWCVLVQPLVRLDAAGLVVRNILREVTLPWPSIARTHARGNLVIDDVEGNSTTAWGVMGQKSGMFVWLRAGLRTKENFALDLARNPVHHGDSRQDDSWRPVPGSYSNAKIKTEALPDVINAEAWDNDSTTSERQVRWMPVPCALIAVAVLCVAAAFLR